MASLFLPAARLLGRMSYVQKFALIGAIVFVVVLFLGATIVSGNHEELSVAQSERDGLAYFRELRPLVEFIPQTRGLTNAYLQGAEELEPRVREARRTVDAALEKLAAFDAATARQLEVVEPLGDISGRWSALSANAFSMPAPEAFAAYTSLMGDVNSLVRRVSERSNLVLDSDLDARFLVGVAFELLPEMTEAAGRARGLGAGLAAAGQIGESERLAISALTFELSALKRRLENAFSAAFENNPALAVTLRGEVAAQSDALERFTATLRTEFVESESVSVDSSAIFEQGTRTLRSAFALLDAVTPLLEERVEQSISASRRTEWTTVGVMIGIVLLMAYLFVGFYQSVAEAVRRMSRASGCVASGKLDVDVEVEGRDEMATLASHFNDVVASFRDVVGGALDSSNAVASAAEELSVTTEQSLSASESQRDEVQQVSTAVEGLSATIGDVAQHADEAEGATRVASEQASTGTSVVAETVAAIGRVAGEVERANEVIMRLGEDSDRIGAVLDVIRGIAEQTNLLALNAAIEAARAGEQGRGFAVVADEVRTLASRTQQSTQEINTMIEQLQQGARQAVEVMGEGREHTRRSVEMASGATDALEAIAQAVGTVSSMNAHIAEAARQQSSAAQEITQRVQCIRQRGEESAEGGRQTAEAATELARLSAAMQSNLGRFEAA